jgi:hypothetical protein
LEKSVIHEDKIMKRIVGSMLIAPKWNNRPSAEALLSELSRIKINTETFKILKKPEEKICEFMNEIIQHGLSKNGIL